MDVGAKIHELEKDAVGFWCPGCGCGHILTINGRRNLANATWTWNGSLDAPTFTPSVNVVGYCHSFVRDGAIQYLADCRHSLAGQTVPLPDWEEKT